MTEHSIHPQTLDPRSAGKVTRYHTWERLKDQSVGEHTWQAIRILLAVWPEAPRELLVYVMFHDVGERVTGDVPYPVKAEHPEVKRGVDALDQRAQLKMVPWGVAPPCALPSEHVSVFKMVEFIEMWEYALDEIAMGNSNCRLIADRCYEQAVTILNSMPLPGGVHLKTVGYVQRRISHEQKHRGYVVTDLSE